MPVDNLFDTTGSQFGPDERFDSLVEAPAFRLERIVSTGQATAAGDWLSQTRAEWVVLLSGSAALQFEDELEARTLRPGDVLSIGPNRRHRVEWTHAAEPTVWLALHYDVAAADPVAAPTRVLDEPS